MPPRLRRLNATHERALRLRLLGATTEAIAREVGRSPARVRDWYRDPLFHSEYLRLQAELQADLDARLRAQAARAAERLVALLDSGDERVALAAARDVLDRAGIRAPERHAVTGPRGGPLQLQWSDGQPFDLA